MRKQLLLTVAPFVVIVVLLVLLATMSMDILSALRAYVEGESLWSKAQKEAVQHLERYAGSRDEEAFQAYLESIRVPLGDRQARLELERAEPDFRQARDGFLAGHNHPDDIPGMIQLFRRFRRVSFMDHAIGIWAAADREIDEIVASANSLHEILGEPGATIESATAIRPATMLRTDVLASTLQRLRAANARATPLEKAFSSTLGDAAREVDAMLQAGMLLLALVLLAIAVTFSRRVMKQNNLIEQALRVSEERFDRAVCGSNDGIWNWTFSDDMLYLSPRASELLGYLAHEVPRNSQALLALVHNNDRDAVRDAIHAVLGTDKLLDIEFRFRDRSGGYRWTQIRGRTLGFIDGQTACMAGSVTDISERKRADALRHRLATDERRQSEQAQIALLEQIQGRMGRELHDDIGQQLTGVAFLAKALEQRLGVASPTEREQTSWIVKLINDVTDRVRFMSRQLSPIEIDELTLGAALTRLVSDIRGIFGTRISLRMSGDTVQISRQHAGQFFRIAQESISNALRHGSATEIIIHLHVWGSVARLTVYDNGCGFSVRAIDFKASLGLRSMAIRAETLRGKLRVRSTARGTTVIVRSLSCTSACRQPIETRKSA